MEKQIILGCLALSLLSLLIQCKPRTQKNVIEAPMQMQMQNPLQLANQIAGEIEVECTNLHRTLQEQTNPNMGLQELTNLSANELCEYTTSTAFFRGLDSPQGYAERLFSLADPIHLTMLATLIARDRLQREITLLEQQLQLPELNREGLSLVDNNPKAQLRRAREELEILQKYSELIESAKRLTQLQGAEANAEEITKAYKAFLSKRMAMVEKAIEGGQAINQVFGGKESLLQPFRPYTERWAENAPKLRNNPTLASFLGQLQRYQEAARKGGETIKQTRAAIASAGKGNPRYQAATEAVKYQKENGIEVARYVRDRALLLERAQPASTELPNQLHEAAAALTPKLQGLFGVEVGAATYLTRDDGFQVPREQRRAPDLPHFEGRKLLVRPEGAIYLPGVTAVSSGIYDRSAQDILPGIARSQYYLSFWGEGGKAIANAADFETAINLADLPEHTKQEAKEFVSLFREHRQQIEALSAEAKELANRPAYLQWHRLLAETIDDAEVEKSLVAGVNATKTLAERYDARARGDASYVEELRTREQQQIAQLRRDLERVGEEISKTIRQGNTGLDPGVEEEWLEALRQKEAEVAQLDRQLNSTAAGDAAEARPLADPTESQPRGAADQRVPGEAAPSKVPAPEASPRGAAPPSDVTTRPAAVADASPRATAPASTAAVAAAGSPPTTGSTARAQEASGRPASPPPGVAASKPSNGPGAAPRQLDSSLPPARQQPAPEPLNRPQAADTPLASGSGGASRSQSASSVHDSVSDSTPRQPSAPASGGPTSAGSPRQPVVPSTPATPANKDPVASSKSRTGLYVLLGLGTVAAAGSIAYAASEGLFLTRRTEPVPEPVLTATGTILQRIRLLADRLYQPSSL